MIVMIPPAVAGPLAVAIAELRKWYTAPNPQVRQALIDLQRHMQAEANAGQRRTPFDPGEIAAQARSMTPLVVTFEAAGVLLARSEKSVQRLVRSGELSTIGSGSGTRVVVASIEEYVSRSSRVAEPERTGGSR